MGALELKADFSSLDQDAKIRMPVINCFLGIAVVEMLFMTNAICQCYN